MHSALYLVFVLAAAAAAAISLGPQLLFQDTIMTKTQSFLLPSLITTPMPNVSPLLWTEYQH